MVPIQDHQRSQSRPIKGPKASPSKVPIQAHQRSIQAHQRSQSWPIRDPNPDPAEVPKRAIKGSNPGPSEAPSRPIGGSKTNPSKVSIQAHQNLRFQSKPIRGPNRSIRGPNRSNRGPIQIHQRSSQIKATGIITMNFDCIIKTKELTLTPNKYEFKLQSLHFLNLTDGRMSNHGHLIFYIYI